MGDVMWRALCVALLAGLGAQARGDWDRPGAPLCPPGKHRRCTLTNSVQDEYIGTVDGHSIVIRFVIGELFRLKCNGSAVLDSDALPYFAEPQMVLRVQLFQCPAPRNASYAQALAALRLVTPEWPDGRVGEASVALRGYENLVITGSSPEHFPTQAHHLHGLDGLLRLTVNAASSRPSPPVTRLLLDGRLASLRVLRLDGTTLAADALLALPAALQELHLVNAGVAAIPAAALRRLPSLAILLVVQNTKAGVSVEAGAAPDLTALTVRARLGPVRLTGPVPRNLTKLEVEWGPRAPLDLRPFGRLVDDGAPGVGANESALQLAGWLAQCPHLRDLSVHGRLAALPAALLAGQRALRRLSLSRCELTELPELLLSQSGSLEELDLSHNRLRRLPSQLLGGTRRLAILKLSYNMLEASAAAVAGTAPADTMRKLHLDYNPLGDLCRGEGASSHVWTDSDSALKKLLSLEELNLRYTNVNRVCRDWRQSMKNLIKLDLTRTNITQLSYAEMQYSRGQQSDVYLDRIPLDNLEYTLEDYNATASAPRAPVTVSMEVTLDCDCRQYWAALVVRNDRNGVRLEKLSCGGVPFERVDLDRLTCDAPQLCPGLRAGCSCRQRPDLDAPGSRALFSCERAGLEEVPAVVGGGAHAWSLRLAGNRIAALPPAALPPVLRELDLSDNNVSRISADFLLGHPETRLRVGGNPLDCHCGAHEDLDALRQGSARVADFAAATCEGGGRLAVPGPCALWEWVSGGAVLAVVALAGVAAAAVLSRAEARLRLKVGLARLGWLPRGPSAAEQGLRFDAFVSYAHQDEETVRELAARLERGRAPLRLCLHERDWAPGGWIPTQIAASVRSSRCTVALVSEHYVRSGWARAEFREAHAAALRDARPRLLVVMLDAPSALPLDDELRDYLATNTYVRWGDPWFWEKLRVALAPSGAGAGAAVPPAAQAPAQCGCCCFGLLNDVCRKGRTSKRDMNMNEKCKSPMSATD